MKDLVTDMKLDLRPMLRGEISHLPVDFTIQYNDINEVSIDSEVLVKGEIVDTAGYMRMTLSVSFEYSGACARCLEPVKGHFETEFVRTVVDEGTLTDEQLDDNIDEYAVISDGFLDIDSQLSEAILFDFPMRLLCADDCLGLCPVCGKPKNDGHSCSAKEVDPRWAVLKGFFDDTDENKN